MGFPSETVDGQVVNIVEKGTLGEQTILRADDGSVYKPSITDPLKLELVEAGQAVMEAVEQAGDVVETAVEIVGEMIESAGNILMSPVEAFEQILNAATGGSDEPTETAEEPANGEEASEAASAA